MPTILARCPKCKKKYHLKDSSLVGKKIKCQKCSTPFRIKAPMMESVEVVEILNEVEEVEEVEVEDADEFDEFAEFGEFTDDFADAGESYESPDAYASPMALPAGGRKLKKAKKSSAGKASGKRESEAEKSKAIPIIIAAVGSLLVIGMIVVVVFIAPSVMERAKESPAVEIPENYVLFDAADSAVKFEYPEGWEVDHGGGSYNAPVWASIKNGGVLIELRENTVGLGGGGSPQAYDNLGNKLPKEMQPIHSAHLFGLELVQAYNSDYRETSPEEFQSGLGEGRISKFKVPGTFSIEVGFRATLMSGRHTFEVTCRCKEGQLEDLTPVFRRILESIGQGKRP